jgi:beta-N-acetylhexosaminidase
VLSNGRNLTIILVSLIVAVVAVVVAANVAWWPRTTPVRTSAATRGAKPTARSSGPAGSSSHPGSHPGGSALPAGAVPPTLGLAPGATSPSASGLLTAERTLPKLNNTQLAGQRVIYSYTGLTPPTRLINLIKAGDVAGVIFFGNNVKSISQMAAVSAQLQKAAMSPSNPVRLPLLLMTDQEGGQVRRLPGEPVLSAKQIGLAKNPWATATTEGRLGAQNMRSAGLNVNLAPVLDVYRQPGNFIDEFGRSFSNNAGKVAKLGTLFAQAEQGQGVAATVKHFPGLGAAATNQDTDVRPVTLNLPLTAIRNIDEKPYKSAIAAKVKLVMVSWAIYPALDAKNPAGLSSTIVQGELRTRLGFGGVTITDALEAGALKTFGSTARRATLAARAGMDLLLCAAGTPSQGASAMNSLAFDYAHKSLNNATFKAAVERILALRASLKG